jgi:structural maintenance of chromosome 2
LKTLIEGRRQALDKEISNIDFALNAKKVNRAELEGEEESGVDRVKKFQSKVDKRKKEIAETDQDMQRHNIDKETHEASLRQARNKKDDLETKITVSDKELNAAKAEERSAIDTEAEIRGKIDEEKNRIAGLEGNKGLCVDQIKKIQDDPEMSWVVKEEPNFNQPNSTYQFQEEDYDDWMETYKDLSTSIQERKKKIDPNIEMVADALEKRFAITKKYKDNIEKGTVILVNNTDVIDEKKLKVIEKCYESVNEDFGKIFGKFLEGANAKLVQVDMHNRKGDFTGCGIEIKCAFNGVWREGLTELSGGQRSLMALSF